MMWLHNISFVIPEYTRKQVSMFISFCQEVHLVWQSWEPVARILTILNVDCAMHDILPHMLPWHRIAVGCMVEEF